MFCLFSFVRQEILSACCFADGNNQGGKLVIQGRKWKLPGTLSLSREGGMGASTHADGLPLSGTIEGHPW